MPLTVGVAGGTGSGKTTVARKLAEALGAETCTTVYHDAYYRDRSHLTVAERKHVNYDHPDALESDLLAEHLADLRLGKAVEAPIYDYVSHTRSASTRSIQPTPVVLVEGIMTLVEPAVRAQLDIKIFVDTDADIRLLRRIERDITERGRSFDSVRDQYYATVRPMHLTFVEPSKRWADLIIPEGGDNAVALDVILARLERRDPR